MGNNSFDPEIPLSLDFVSFHKKGNGGVDVIVDEEMATLADLRDRFPFLRNIRVVNDEGDPLKGEQFRQIDAQLLWMRLVETPRLESWKHLCCEGCKVIPAENSSKCQTSNVVGRNIWLHKQQYIDREVWLLNFYWFLNFYWLTTDLLQNSGINFDLLSNDNAFLSFPPNPVKVYFTFSLRLKSQLLVVWK